ncbi:kielin/chordin-like protein [Amphibalanus amphitrite]|uniref:kielin/chordin-like protein n=1 Tax=Amphibalanus amphitrite TaxID=1232801 RepID=UPI001C912454|nr:kielin/chordin-like protein [Amphibalanus amphitrite]
MSRTGTPAAVLATLLAVILVDLALLPPSAAGESPALTPCSVILPRHCTPANCALPVVTESCCRCHNLCCGSSDNRQKSDDIERGDLDSTGSESSEAEEQPAESGSSGAQTTEDNNAAVKLPQPLVLAPKSLGFLPPGYQPISDQDGTTSAPATCVEPGFPAAVRQHEDIWPSLVNRCLYLKCLSGTVHVILNKCGDSSTTSPPTTPATAATPTTTSAVSVARWASHYYPCVDPNTGDVYQHGETRQDTELSCGFFLCSNGSWVFGGFHCPTPGIDPDLPGPDLPDPGAPVPDPLDPPVVIFPLPTSSAPPGATTLSPNLPTVVPRPSPEDGPWEPDSSCVDDFGQTQASGNTWLAPGQLCVYYRCQSGIISSFTKSCSPPPPGCVTGPVLPGKCCPSVSCPQSPRDCTFDDRTYRSGEVFADNPLHPCQQLRCDDGLVVSMGPPTFCLAVYCSQPEWPEGACCKTCPGGELPKELEELKQLVLRLGRRLNLPAELMSRLEESVNRLVAQLAALLHDSDDSVTLDTLLNNLIEMTDILNSLATGVADQSITLLEVLLGQLRVRLLAIVDQLRPSITDEQISNARIDIDEFVAWLRAFPSADRTSAAGILINDLTRLFSGLLMEPGCTDAVGTVHPVDTLYVDNPEAPNTCFVCANLSSGVSPLAVMNISECGGPPPAGCTARLEPNSCCPRVSCSPGAAACRDDRGELHPHGSTFFDDPKYPCITFNCTDGVAAVVDKVSCMALPDGCSPWKMKGFCCPKSDCPAVECVHEGRRRDDGTTWPADPLRPCVVHTCLGGQVTSEDRSDQCLPPPASHCVPRLVDYRCCPQYDCVRVNCTYRGRMYREGETWSDDPQYPCRRYRCTRRGTERIQDQTVLCKGRPHAGCTGHRDIGQCCKQWICPQCEHGNRTYSEGDVFWADPDRRCVQMACREGVTVQLTPQTTCPPVPAGCTPVYSGTTCCHVKYTCPFCMFDPQGNFIQMVLEGRGDSGA